MAFTPEWHTAIAETGAALGVATGGWAAMRGLEAWRMEVVGRRKAELAEEVLAQFYRARDILGWARMPAEGANLAPLGEAERGGAGASTPVERLTLESRLFSELQASRYRFMAFFGEEAAKPFDEIRAIHAEVVRSSESLARDEGGTGDEATKNREAWRRSIGWNAASGDPLAVKIERAVHDIEHICRPFIDETVLGGRSRVLFRRRHRDH